jgi:hypothetical protein
MYAAFDNSGNHILKWPAIYDTLDIYSHFTTKIWPLGPKQLFMLPKFHLSLSISLFEDRNIGVNSKKTLLDLLTLNARNKFSFMDVFVQLLYSLRQGFLTFFCAMDSFESWVKPSHKNVFKYI